MFKSLLAAAALMLALSAVAAEPDGELHEVQLANS